VTTNRQIPRCPVCDAAGPAPLDSRPSVPIAQNLMYRSLDAALRCPQGALEIVRCMRCGFAWNAAFDQALLTYDADYENNQSLSPAFDRHLDEVAEAIRAGMDGRGAISAVEVGCGQGYFLHRLVAAFGDRLTSLVAFDPAFRHGSPIPGRARVVPTLFNKDSCQQIGAPPDLIVTRHVIEHVPDPIAFLGGLREASRRGPIVAIETPSLQWILNGAVAHDFYYEHCSLFDAESLRFAMEACGFEGIEVSERLDGQYLLALGRAGEKTSCLHRAEAPDNANYVERRAGYVDHWRRAFAKDRSAGEKIAIWGGASKGVTLTLLVGDQAGDISAAIDINPAREGSFMPVSGLRVVLPETAQRERITKAYVVNPVYREEIAQYCREHGWELKLSVVA
jgi:hypothetical protein